jgi:hypothetical protein
VKKSIYLVIAILIPILMIVIISALTYLDQINLTPEHNFIYGMINNVNKFNCVTQIKSTIFSAQAKDQKKKEMTLQCQEPDLYLYDVKTDAIKKITLDEVKKLVSPATSTSQSSDGFTISEYCDSSRVLVLGIFSTHYYSPICIKKENYAKRLKIESPAYKENKSFFFIGWTTEKT